MASRMFAWDRRRLRSKTGGRREFTTKDTKNESEVKTGSLMNLNLCGLGFPQFAANIVIPAHAGIQWFVVDTGFRRCDVMLLIPRPLAAGQFNY